ncbi:MAG: RNA 2',3'-cyclic phosphodiesterase [Streptosporangiaceae bacterium]
MRLFVALAPPPEILHEIETAVAAYRAEWPTLRWVRRDLWHVTLAFLGEVEDRRVPPLMSRLERTAARYPSLRLSFAGAGAFPSAGSRSGRVLWTGIDGDRRALARLADSVSAAARHAGIDVGERKRSFSAHLTLARVREPTCLRPLVDGLSSYVGTPWDAGELCLVRSHLGREPRYETIGAWPLRGAAGPPSEG